MHAVWQLDAREGTRLADESVVTTLTIADEHSSALIASRAFSVRTPRRWRKLTVDELRETLRGAFREWGTLPNVVQTDNELRLSGNPSDPYPSQLTSWLVGLGVSHRFSRPAHPTDQAEIERSHRTLSGRVDDAVTQNDMTTYQAALDHERDCHNRLMPSRAQACAGQPPLVAHPELLIPCRPYHPNAELALFDLARVEASLATFTFERQVSASGTVGLGGQIYSVGRPHARVALKAHFDPSNHAWVFRDATGQELARRPIKGLDVVSLTGLDLEPLNPAPPIQLSLPLPLAA